MKQKRKVTNMAKDIDKNLEGLSTTTLVQLTERTKVFLSLLTSELEKRKDVRREKRNDSRAK